MKIFRNHPFFITFCAVVGLALLTAAPQFAEAAEIVVKFGHIQAPGSPLDKDANFFADLVKLKSGGRIEVQVLES